MASRTRAGISQPEKTPPAGMAIFPYDLQSGAFSLEDAYLHRCLCFLRQVLLGAFCPSRLCFGNKPNAFVPHVSSLVRQPFLNSCLLQRADNLVFSQSGSGFPPPWQKTFPCAGNAPCTLHPARCTLYQ